MAALEISDFNYQEVRANAGEPDGIPNPTVVELFLAGSGGVYMRAILGQGEGQLQDWESLSYHAIITLAKLMYPFSLVLEWLTKYQSASIGGNRSFDVTTLVTPPPPPPLPHLYMHSHSVLKRNFELLPIFGHLAEFRMSNFVSWISTNCYWIKD